MPRCLNCGNNMHFASASVPALAPWNAAGSGLVGYFDPEGSILNLENSGVDGEVMKSAWESPHNHFDRCSRCGSTNIQWP